VIETAKFNVITAYSGAEALATIEIFPNVDAAIVDTNMRDMSTNDLIAGIKKLNPLLPVILICGAHQQCPAADHHVDLFDTAGLLALLRSLYPRAATAIEQSNQSLSEEGG
jgi:DNA-binding NtrC family response regulator